MPVPTVITDLSQTAASNYPAGSDSPATLDDTQRAHGAFIAQLRDGKGFANPVNLASATTTDIGGQNSQFVEISGTTTITSFGTTYNGPRYLRFTGALLLTYNATTLNLPGAANITTAAGDTAIAVPNLALNGWNVISYQRAATASYAAAGANSDITSLSGLTTALSIAQGGTGATSGVLVYQSSSMPSSGSYTAGVVVLEASSLGRISGWKRLTTGSGHVLNTDWLYFTNITSGTAVATTSGTSIDFTGIPSGVKRVTLSIASLSTNGTSTVQVQLGAGSVQTSGYTSGVIQGSSGAAAALAPLTTGFYLAVPTAATMTADGVLTLVLLDSTIGLWAASGNTSDSVNGRDWSISGAKTLSGVLDRLRITTVGGVNTFDLGSANLLWEF